MDDKQLKRVIKTVHSVQELCRMREKEYIDTYGIDQDRVAASKLDKIDNKLEGLLDFLVDEEA